MAERPVVPAVSELLYGELAVSQPGDEARGWPFLIFLGGLGTTLGPLHDLVRDSAAGPGWSSLLDPTRAPGFGLPWLAQFAGVRLQPDLPEAQRREQITSPPAFERGTREALRATAARTLTGDRRVTIRERDGTPWQTTVITYTSETPDPAVTERDVMTQEMGGERLVYRVDPGWQIDQFEAAYSGQTLADIELAFLTVGDLGSNLPA